MAPVKRPPVPMTPERAARIAERLRDQPIEPAAAPPKPTPQTPGEFIERAIDMDRRKDRP